MNILNVIKESVHNDKPFNMLALSSANPLIILRILRIVLAFYFPKYIVSEDILNFLRIFRRDCLRIVRNFPSDRRYGLS